MVIVCVYVQIHVYNGVCGGGDIIHLITSAKSCENPKMYGNTHCVCLCVFHRFVRVQYVTCTVVVVYVWGSFSIVLIISPRTSVIFPSTCMYRKNQQFPICVCVFIKGKMLYTVQTEIKCLLIVSIYSAYNVDFDDYIILSVTIAVVPYTSFSILCMYGMLWKETYMHRACVREFLSVYFPNFTFVRELMKNTHIRRRNNLYRYITAVLLTIIITKEIPYTCMTYTHTHIRSYVKHKNLLSIKTKTEKQYLQAAGETENFYLNCYKFVFATAKHSVVLFNKLACQVIHLKILPSHTCIQV